MDSPNGSAPGSLSAIDWKKIGKNVLFTSLSAGLTYLLSLSSETGTFGVYAPAVMGTINVGIYFLSKLSGDTRAKR